LFQVSDEMPGVGAIGGRLRVESPPGQGTTLGGAFPLATEAPASQA